MTDDGRRPAAGRARGRGRRGAIQNRDVNMGVAYGGGRTDG